MIMKIFEYPLHPSRIVPTTLSLLLLLSVGSASPFLLSWLTLFGRSGSLEKYVLKSELRHLSWSSEASLKGSEAVSTSSSFFSSWLEIPWSSSPKRFNGLFMKCLPMKPDRICPLSLKSASCERESPEEPWKCRGHHDEDSGDLSRPSVDIQINYLGVDCPDERDESLVNPESCVLRYSLYRDSVHPPPSIKRRSYLREILLFLCLLAIASLCAYFLYRNTLQRRRRRLMDFLAANSILQEQQLASEGGGGGPLWSYKEDKERLSEENELSLLNSERRRENICPTRRRIRRSKSVSRGGDLK